MTLDNPLIGTWRLRSFHVWNEQGEASEPLGAHPIGYAIFDRQGRAFIQLLCAHEAGASQSTADPAAIAASYGGYFGSYAVDVARSMLTIQVQGSNLPAYIGSTQERVFSLSGSVLELGQPGKYRAIVERA